MIRTLANRNATVSLILLSSPKDQNNFKLPLYRLGYIIKKQSSRTTFELYSIYFTYLMYKIDDVCLHIYKGAKNIQVSKVLHFIISSCNLLCCVTCSLNSLKSIFLIWSPIVYHRIYMKNLCICFMLD